MKFEIVCKIST